MSNAKTMDKLVKKHFNDQIDAETHRLITLATYDLYFGPIGPTDDDGKPWPGFSKACDIIRERVNVSDVWVSDYDEIMESEPDWDARNEPEDGEDEGTPCYCSEDWWHYSESHAKRVVFGELANYL